MDLSSHLTYPKWILLPLKRICMKHPDAFRGLFYLSLLLRMMYNMKDDDMTWKVISFMEFFTLGETLRTWVKTTTRLSSSLVLLCGFSQCSGTAAGREMPAMSVRAVVPPHWNKLKYLINCAIDCHQIFWHLTLMDLWMNPNDFGVPLTLHFCFLLPQIFSGLWWN